MVKLLKLSKHHLHDRKPNTMNAQESTYIHNGEPSHGEYKFFNFEMGERGTIEEGLHKLKVRALNIDQALKYLKRWCDDMCETKGRTLKAIVHDCNEPGRIDFEFCGRTITFYQLED